MPTSDNSKWKYIHIYTSHNLHSEHTTTLLSLTSEARASTITVRALIALPSDNKTVMTANTRWSGEARGIYYSAKGPPVCLSACLSDWLVGWQCISTTVAAAAMAPHNNCWLGSWSQLLDPSQQPVCSTPLIYVHWRWCKVVEKLYSITALFVCQATVTIKWVRGVRRRERVKRSPGGYARYRHLIVPISMRLNSNHSHTIPMHL